MNDKFKGLISLADAAKLYNKKDCTLRLNIRNGFFKENIDCVKFGTTWVFDKEALIRAYNTKNTILEFNDLYVIREDHGDHLYYRVNNKFNIIVDDNNSIINYTKLDINYEEDFSQIYDRVQNIILKFDILSYLKNLGIDISELENEEISNLIKLSK